MGRPSPKLSLSGRCVTRLRYADLSALERWMIHKLRSSSDGAANTTPLSGAPSLAVRRNA